MSYQSVSPNSARDNYRPGEIVDFIINLPAGREIVAGSFRLSGSLQVTKAANFATPMTGTEQIFYDSKAGAHALINQVQCSLNGMTIENFPHYARFAKQYNVCQESDIQAVGNLGGAIALRMADDLETNAILGVTGITSLGRSFSFKPLMALNRTTSNITPAKGEVKVSIILSNVNQFLFGAGVTADISYQLFDVLLSYRTIPLQTQGNAPLTMRVESALKQIVTSNNTNLSVNNPIQSQAMSMSFIAVADESTLTSNYLNMALLPQVSRIEFSMNDVTAGSTFNFPLETQQEILMNFIRSMGGVSTWAVRNDGTNYGVGLAYNSYMQNMKLGLLIQSGILSTAPYACYLYFHGMITV